MVSRRTRVAFWIFRRDHPSRPNAMICCFFSSFKTFAIVREATYPPAAVNVLDVSSESMAAFQVFMYGRFWVFTEAFLMVYVGPFVSRWLNSRSRFRLSTDQMARFSATEILELTAQSGFVVFAIWLVF